MFWNPEVITSTGKSLCITQIQFNIIYIMRTNSFNVTGVTGIITKTKKNGDGDTENAERCEGEFNAQMRVPGQHENNSDRKEKIE